MKLFGLSFILYFFKKSTGHGIMALFSKDLSKQKVR